MAPALLAANSLALLAVMAAPAWADDRAPSPDDSEGRQSEAGQDLSAEDQLFLDPSITGEAIEVWGERPQKPFRRDTILRLSGEQLARRGVNNLAEALELLPDVTVRPAGRGGQQVEIRGARKGSLKILIDGISVGDPYYGNLDLSAIPVTDIVQIRVSSSPASPIDGTGGPGGVVEVHTRDGVGDRLVIARMTGTTLPSAEVSATGRTMLSEHLGVRLSANSSVGARDFDIHVDGQDPSQLAEDRQQVHGAVRLEYRNGERRAAVDSSVQTGSYLQPPFAENSSNFLRVDRDNRARVGVVADDIVRSWRVQGNSYLQYLGRDTSVFDDADLQMLVREEQLTAYRWGGGVLGSRPMGRRTQGILSLSVDTEDVSVDGFDGSLVEGQASILGMATGVQLELDSVSVDAAVGLAAPFGIDAAFWPEAKVTTTYAPVENISYKLIGGRKGRLPTMRERFSLDTGNESLGPEQVWFIESEIKMRTDWVTAIVSSYLRRTNGQIRFDGDLSQLINSGEFDLRGVEAQLLFAPEAPLGGGASWTFTDVFSETLGTNSLDFLPRHRTALWLTGRHGPGGATIRMRQQSSQVDRGATLDARTLFDASLWAKLPYDLSATVRVDNLLGTDYDERTNVPAPGTVATAFVQAQW